ncbi:putative EF-hand domain pair protein [Rosa chinensis]|uniref:Putative EF-hand domain pair protein n=1 Tax=Rosa chinensis TaxID=74649 RepID=A0A2P6QRP1_ROSCH|nr:putative EF-hand domain pair protein [Rosa chinensis]
MEEIREVALAYYDNCTPELRGKTWEFFQSMDTNGDHRISAREFNEFLRQTGYNTIITDPELFARLDRNGDSGLDFDEVLTFYYIIKTEYVRCRGCNKYLSGLYFTCFECFEAANPSTFDLCDACHRSSNFTHHHSDHTLFLENHILLYYKRGPDDSMAMEYLYAQALEYYDKATPELKRSVMSFFQSMVTHGANQVSLSVFNDFLKQNYYDWIFNDPLLFQKLDRNRDGGLDFWELLTFYYIIHTRYFNCRECQVYLGGLYFTCVACFEGGAHYRRHHHSDLGTYNLCAACYRSRNFVSQHPHHTFFLDNHILLRSKRGLPPYATPSLVNYTVIKSHLVL